MNLDAIRDPDTKIIAGLSAVLSADYVKGDDDPWRGSPFEWIQSRPSRQKGAIGESLVAGWAAAKGLDVARNLNSDADRIIHGQRIEIKYSNLWTDNGIYKFQQIRDQDYDYCLCMGISPWEVHGWLFPKSELMLPIDHAERPGLVPQHGGASGLDTRWLSFTASNPPAWIAPFGGRLGQVYDLLVAAGRGTHRGR